MAKNIEIKKKKVLLIIFISIIFVTLIFGTLFYVKSNQKLDNGYIDLTKHNSVEFSLNENGDSYTIERKYGFLFSTKAPDILFIPETYNDKPVTILKGPFDNNIIKLLGSKNLISIASSTFAETSRTSHRNLQEVIFPKDGKLKEFQRWCFFNCGKLQKVVVPENFESFSVGTFYKCGALSTLIIYNEIPPSGATMLFKDGYNENFEYGPAVDFIVYVPDEAVNEYLKSEWRRYNIRPISDII